MFHFRRSRVLVSLLLSSCEWNWNWKLYWNNSKYPFLRWNRSEIFKWKQKQKINVNNLIFTWNFHFVQFTIVSIPKSFHWRTRNGNRSLSWCVYGHTYWFRMQINPTKQKIRLWTFFICCEASLILRCNKQ